MPSVGDIFGAQAHLVVQPEGMAEPLFSLTDNVVVWVAAVMLFVYYLFVVFAYGGYIGQMAKIVVRGNLGIRVADELSYLFVRAVRNSVAMGVIMWALVAVGWLEMCGVESVAELRTMWLTPVIAAVSVAIGSVQRLLTNAICTLTRRGEVAEGLGILADTLMGLAAIVATPIALLFVVNTGASMEMLGWVLVGVACVALFAYVVKSFVFFIEQKISILLWFLYLCTVVLIPIGAMLTVMVRISVT